MAYRTIGHLITPKKGEGGEYLMAETAHER
jgi:hypothetical protein